VAIVKMVLSLFLSREPYDLNKIWCIDANFVPKDGHVTNYQNLANSKWRTAATLKNRFWLYPSDLLPD